jgi:dynein heavy chain 1
MIAKLMRMQILEEADASDALAATSPDEEKRMADGRPAWMKTLHNSVSTWLKLVPEVGVLSLFLHLFSVRSH